MWSTEQVSSSAFARYTVTLLEPIKAKNPSAAVFRAVMRLRTSSSHFYEGSNESTYDLANSDMFFNLLLFLLRVVLQLLLQPIPLVSQA
jgi:hypothetical protein